MAPAQAKWSGNSSAKQAQQPAVGGGRRDPVGGPPHRLRRVRHRDAEAGLAQHLEVVLLVAHRDDPIERHAHVLGEPGQRGALRGGDRDDLEVVVARAHEAAVLGHDRGQLAAHDVEIAGVPDEQALDEGAQAEELLEVRDHVDREPFLLAVLPDREGALRAEQPVVAVEDRVHRRLRDHRPRATEHAARQRERHEVGLAFAAAHHRAVVVDDRRGDAELVAVGIGRSGHAPGGQRDGEPARGRPVEGLHQRRVELHGVVEQGPVEIADQQVVPGRRRAVAPAGRTHARRSPWWKRAAHSRLQK